MSKLVTCKGQRKPFRGRHRVSFSEYVFLYLLQIESVLYGSMVEEVVHAEHGSAQFMLHGLFRMYENNRFQNHKIIAHSFHSARGSIRRAVAQDDVQTLGLGACNESCGTHSCSR